jgi:hypothetical protein
MTNLEQINADMTEYFAMQDCLLKLNDNGAISQREFEILLVTINNRLCDFADMKREALVEAIVSYDSSQDIDNLSIKMNYALEDILESVKRA